MGTIATAGSSPSGWEQLPLLEQYQQGGNNCHCWSSTIRMGNKRHCCINTIRMGTIASAGSIPPGWEQMPLLDQYHMDGNECHCWVNGHEEQMQMLDQYNQNHQNGNKCHCWINTIWMGTNGWEQMPLLDQDHQDGNKCHCWSNAMKMEPILPPAGSKPPGWEQNATAGSIPPVW